LVRDEFSPLGKERLIEHVTAIRARLTDRLGHLIDNNSMPSRRDERELRFMLDELIEAMHRLAHFGGRG
jgi:hypothetical protein